MMQRAWILSGLFLEINFAGSDSFCEICINKTEKEMTHEFESHYIFELDLEVSGEIEVIETGHAGIGYYEFHGEQGFDHGGMELECRIIALEVSGPDDYEVTESDRNKAWDWVMENFERLID